VICPKCGYVMSDFDEECPRCKRMAQQQDKAYPAVKQDGESPAPPAGESVKTVKPPPTIPLQRRSDTLLWAVLAIGLVVILLLGGLLWALVRGPLTGGRAGTVAQVPLQPVQPSVAPQGGVYPAIPPQTQPPATTRQPLLPQRQQATREPLQYPGNNLATGRQVTGEALPGGDSFARGQQVQPPPTRPTTWREVARFQGSGTFTTAPITVRQPWRVRYYTGSSSGSILDLDIFSIFPDKGPLSLPIVTVQNSPNTWGEGYGRGAGTFPLTIVTTYNNWLVIVEQGE